jgi:hypothetical protein
MPRFLDAALLQYTQISALPNPENFNFEGLRNWIVRPDRGNYSIGGSGVEHGVISTSRRLPKSPGNNASSFFVAFLAGNASTWRSLISSP